MIPINEVMMNPARLRIVQIAAAKSRVTTGEICAQISDIPRTTVYRHIKTLLDSGVLCVVEEKKIRGSTERTLSLNQELLSQDDTQSIPQQALGFLMGTYAKFERYFQNRQPTDDKQNIFFNNTVMMMDDGEFDAFLAELHTLLARYHLGAGAGRKPRDITIVSSPVESEQENETDA